MTIAERIKLFIKESKEEYRHVNWPTRQEAIYLTSIVVVFSLFISLFLGLSDTFFVYLLRNFVI
ncbi:MAG: preprotein translocase subunit SecE [Anaplasmataceae bacterium]|nr:preprotein translocase subunit SecE [Anaplasmataceae bacterium]